MWIRTPRRQGRRLPTSSLYRIGARGGLPPSGPAPGRTVSAAAEGTSPAAPCACCTSRPSGAARGPGAHQPRRRCEVQAASPAPGRGARPRGQAAPGCSRPGTGWPVVRTLGRAGRSSRERPSRLPRRMDDPKGREERKSGPFPGTPIPPLPSGVSGCPVMRAGGRQGRARGTRARHAAPGIPLAPGSPSARPFSPQPREAAPRIGSRVPRAGHFPVHQT